jgi:hypothetical protein
MWCDVRDGLLNPFRSEGCLELVVASAMARSPWPQSPEAVGVDRPVAAWGPARLHNPNWSTRQWPAISRSPARSKVRLHHRVDDDDETQKCRQSPTPQDICASGRCLSPHRRQTQTVTGSHNGTRQPADVEDGHDGPADPLAALFVVKRQQFDGDSVGCPDDGADRGACVGCPRWRVSAPGSHRDDGEYGHRKDDDYL